MIMEQIAIAFFLFTGNSLFLEWSRRCGRIMDNDDSRASSTPSQGLFKIAVVRAYYEVYERINAGDVGENVAF